MNHSSILYRIFKWSLIAVVMVTFLHLSVLLVVPATFMLVRKWFVPAPEIANQYLMQAIGLTAAFLSTWFLVKYIFGWDTLVRILGMDPRKKFIGFAGITLVAVLYLLGMWWATENKSVSSKIPKRALAASGEILPEFLLNIENLDTLPWVDTNGNFQFFWCASPNGLPRLYVRSGSCITGGMRARLTREVQERLYDAVRSYQNELAKKYEDLQAQNTARFEQIKTQFGSQLERNRLEVAALLESFKKQFDGQLEKDQLAVVTLQETLRRQIDSLSKRLSDSMPETKPEIVKKPRTDVIGFATESAHKLKARVLVLEPHVFGIRQDGFGGGCSAENAGIKFEVTEKSGVSVVYDRYRLSIWIRGYSSESPDQTKRGNNPIILNKVIDDWTVKGGAQLGHKIFSLGRYNNWLNCRNWIELVFYGRDYNGNPQVLKVETAADST